MKTEEWPPLLNVCRVFALSIDSRVVGMEPLLAAIDKASGQGRPGDGTVVTPDREKLHGPHSLGGSRVTKADPQPWKQIGL